MTQFTKVSMFQGEAYYFNCKECGEPLFVAGDPSTTDTLRMLGICETCIGPKLRKAEVEECYIPEREFMIEDVVLQSQEITRLRTFTPRPNKKKSKDLDAIQKRIDAIVERQS